MERLLELNPEAGKEICDLLFNYNYNKDVWFCFHKNDINKYLRNSNSNYKFGSGHSQKEAYNEYKESDVSNYKKSALTKEEIVFNQQIKWDERD
jgi:hypothetical protein